MPTINLNKLGNEYLITPIGITVKPSNSEGSSVPTYIPDELYKEYEKSPASFEVTSEGLKEAKTPAGTIDNTEETK